MKTLREQLKARRERDAEEHQGAGPYEPEIFGADWTMHNSYKAGAEPRDELIEKLAEALECVKCRICDHDYICMRCAALAELECFVAGEKK